MALLLGGCSFAPAPVFPRPALPLPASMMEGFELPGPPRLLRLEHSADGAGQFPPGEGFR